MKRDSIQFEQVFLDSHTNLLFMGIVILVSATTSAIFINGNLGSQEMVLQIIPKLTLATAISFSIFFLCFMVDGSSTFIIIMVFLSITLAVLQAFTGATILGLFTKDRVFFYSIDIWYNAEQATLLTGTAFVFLNIIVLLVYVSYLAPTFRHHMGFVFYERQNDEEASFATNYESDNSLTQNAKLTETVKANKRAHLFHKKVRSTMELKKGKLFTNK